MHGSGSQPPPPAPVRMGSCRSAASLSPSNIPYLPPDPTWSELPLLQAFCLQLPRKGAPELNQTEILPCLPSHNSVAEPWKLAGGSLSTDTQGHCSFGFLCAVLLTEDRSFCVCVALVIQQAFLKGRDYLLPCSELAHGRSRTWES